MSTAPFAFGATHDSDERPVQERDSWVTDVELEGVISMLSRRTAGLPDANDPQRRIGSGGVGCNIAEAYINNVFALRDYCWCDGSRHPETVEWDVEDDSVYLEMPPSGGTSSGCPLNFEHFASGIKAEWHKHLGRDVLFNRAPEGDEAMAVFMDCLRSLPGMDHLPAVKDSHRRAYGWQPAPAMTAKQLRSRLFRAATTEMQAASLQYCTDEELKHYLYLLPKSERP